MQYKKPKGFLKHRVGGLIRPAGLRTAHPVGESAGKSGQGEAFLEEKSISKARTEATPSHAGTCTHWTRDLSGYWGWRGFNQEGRPEHQGSHVLVSRDQMTLQPSEATPGFEEEDGNWFGLWA